MGRPQGCITLADLRDRGVERLVLACARCNRRGVYGITRLIEVHGAAMGLPELRALLTAGCAGRQGSGSTVACGAVYPELASLWTPAGTPQL